MWLEVVVGKWAKSQYQSLPCRSATKIPVLAPVLAPVLSANSYFEDPYASTNIHTILACDKIVFQYCSIYTVASPKPCTRRIERGQ